MSIQLGHVYKDMITGFSGVATGKVQYLTGCNQVLLTPKVDGEGKLRDGSWLDEARLELLDSYEPVVLNAEAVQANPGPDATPPGY